MLNENCPQCTAKSKSTGERCKNPAAYGYSVCRLHGAHPPGKSKGGNPNIRENHKTLNTPEKCKERSERMKGNSLKKTHGLKETKIKFTDDEKLLYQAVIDSCQQDYPHLKNSTDEITLQMLAHAVVMQARARMAYCLNPTTRAISALNGYSEEVSRLLKELKIRRDVRGDAETATDKLAGLFQGLLLPKQGAEIVLTYDFKCYTAGRVFTVQSAHSAGLTIKENPDDCEPTYQGDGEPFEIDTESYFNHFAKVENDEHHKH